MTTINWNKPILPDSFLGFVDSTFFGQTSNNLKKEGHHPKLKSYLSCVSQIDFDSVVITDHLAKDLDNDRNNINLYLTTSTKIEDSLDELLKLKPYGINIEFNIIEDISHQNLTKLKKIASKTRENNLEFRILLTNFYKTPANMLIDIINFFIKINANRVTIYDRKDSLSTLGIKNLFNILYKETHLNKHSQTKLEFSGNSDTEQALKKSIAAIEAGVSYVHTTLSLGLSSKGNPSLSALLNHYSEYQAPLNIQCTKQKLQLFDSELPLGSNYESHCTSISTSNFNIPNLSPINPVMDINADNNHLITEQEQIEDLSRMEMIFSVSADSWHVCLTIKYNNRCFDLGERVHHYVLLLLAQEYTSQYDHLVQRNMEIDPINLGWAERETLREMIGDNETQFNVKICRAKKQICDALGIKTSSDYSPVSTRKGSIRLQCGNVTIIRGSKIECRIHNWHYLDDTKHQGEVNHTQKTNSSPDSNTLKFPSPLDTKGSVPSSNFNSIAM